MHDERRLEAKAQIPEAARPKPSFGFPRPSQGAPGPLVSLRKEVPGVVRVGWQHGPRVDGPSKALEWWTWRHMRKKTYEPLPRSKSAGGLCGTMKLHPKAGISGRDRALEEQSEGRQGRMDGECSGRAQGRAGR